MKRAAGILLPVASLPSKYGIGAFTEEAYDFVRFLAKAGQRYWQILPLGPTGYGDSPYQSFSTFAGNPYFIDLDVLVDMGLLTQEEIRNTDLGSVPERVDYEKIYYGRNALLKKAYERCTRELSGYRAFETENAYWLEDYALYSAIKEHFGSVSFLEWPEEVRRRDEQVLAEFRESLSDTIDLYKFQQYLFSTKWKALKEYANQLGIQIIGDLPIYVALDSADTWAHPELFQLQEDGLPSAVAGCPPDAFAADGQLWGNPLYDWEYHDETGYAWWMQRLGKALELYDIVRIDHFRGFDSYYSIPYGDKTAANGHWEIGPGKKLIDCINQTYGPDRIIAEDLGYLTDSVLELVRHSGYPGMKVIQFAFDSREAGNYLPHNYEKNTVVYTGTHDNDTMAGWCVNVNRADYDMAQRYMDFTDETIPDGHPEKKFIRLALGAVSDTAIIPMQDYLGLGSEARINTPSTLGTNWLWRMKKGVLTDELAEEIRELTELYGRS